MILKRPLKLFTVKRITRSGLSNLSSCPNCCRVMAFWPTDRRQSLSSLYEKIHKEDESDNLWASLLKGLFNLIQRKMYLRITYCIQSVLIFHTIILEVAANKHNTLPNKNLLVLGMSDFTILNFNPTFQTFQETKSPARRLSWPSCRVMRTQRRGRGWTSTTST